jgi:hypothetical protein
MAQQDATEQIKEVLRQVIKYRFWIAVSFAALFAVIAYFMGSGPVQKAAADETTKIKAAESGVKKYNSLSVPTDQYKPIIVEKTQLEEKDVNKAWKELYDRQAPLLTWPETVQLRGDHFRKWGRKWPAETEDAGKVQLAFVDYTYAYMDYVDLVFKTFHPFDYETGTGIVASPPKEALLRPVQFSAEERPDLGKVWAAQERLWLQRTLLEVVAQVNKSANAKDWDSAIIKEVESIEVGNPTAQDQKSLADGEELKKADEILAPGQESQSADAAGAGAAGGGMSMSTPGGSSMSAGMARMAGMMGGRGATGSSPGAATTSGSQYDETIYSIPPPNDKGQYRILPIFMSVLIDQDRVQDFLVALENSPMSIQVMEIGLARPQSRVVKPEKGNAPASASMMGGMGSMMRMMSGGQAGYGGVMSQMSQQMRMQMSQFNMPGGRAGMMGGGYPGGMGAATTKRKGTDIRNVDRGAERKNAEKAVEEKKGPSLFDPYFQIVEVTVYGRARFFNAPPADPEAEPSPGEIPAAAAPAVAAPGGAVGAQEKPEAAKSDGTGVDASKKAPGAPADENAPAKDGAEKPAAKPADTAKPDAKAAAPAKVGSEKPAAKPADAAKPDGKAAVPKS